MTVSPVEDTANILKHYHMYEQWLSKAAEKSKAAKPKQFTEKMKWMDWRDLFVIFLSTQPGRNGIPLSYIIREHQQPVVCHNTEFLDDYVDQAILDGPAFASDANEVHMYLVNFIIKNQTA